MLFKLGGNRGLRQKAHTTEPYLIDLSIAPANALDILTMVGGSSGEADAALI